MYYTDPKDPGTEYPNGSKSFHTHRPWCQLSKVKNCPIAGTEIRLTAWVTGEPTTYFSIPAFIQYKRKSIRGFISGDCDGLYFVPYPHSKNYHVLNCKN